MKHFLVLFTVTCLAFYTNAQDVSISGTVRDFETSKPLTGATILEDEIGNGDVVDSQGNFRFTLKGTSKTIKCRYMGYYLLVVKNIPTHNDSLELEDLKMVKNYSDHIIVELAPDILPDMKRFKVTRKWVEDEYRITIDGITYKPIILERSIVFDLNKPIVGGK